MNHSHQTDQPDGSSHVDATPVDLEEAIEHSEFVCRTPKALAAYRAAAPKQSIVRRAICDYLYPPVILDIAVDPGPVVAGKRVKIWAYDDTKIVCLSLRILDAAGHQLESGRTHESGDCWEYYVGSYAAERMATIEVGASDLAGNFTDKVQAVNP